jgi:hypothetical protein
MEAMLSGYESRRQLQCIGHAAGEHEEHQSDQSA